MKSKLLLLCYFLLTLSFVVSANETQIIPLTVVVDGSNDGPSQDGKDPTTPNQFIATINNHIFSVKTTLNEIVYLEIFNTKGEKIINTDFRDKFTCELEDNGNYKLQLRYQDIELEGYFDVTFSQDEAASIVMKMFKNKDVEISVFNEIYTTGDTIRLVRPSPSQDIIVNESSWVAFVDLHPFGNWSHPCEYILINAYTGIPTTYARTDFPKETERTLYDIPDKYKTAQVPTVDDAFLIVDSMYKNDMVNIYMYATCFKGNKTIELMSPVNDNIELSYPYSTYRYWVALVDLYPMANWSHPCEYIFIDIFYGTIMKITKNMPPMQLGELFIPKRLDITYDSVGIVRPKYHNKILQKKSQSYSSDYPAETPESSKWAVIISGGFERDRNYIRYWNDCAAVYSTLLNYGYSADHIFVAISDGLDDGADYKEYGSSTYNSSPWDLDGNGTDDIQYAADRDGIYQLFNDIGSVMPEGDELFVFTTDHGSIVEGDSYLCLWNQGFMADHEFASLVGNLNPGILNVVMEQCHSGGFIDDFQNLNLNSFVISTACAPEQSSYTMENGLYDEYIYWWCTAINGITPDGIEIDHADYNNDGYISMYEAHIYACTHDTRLESPMQYSDTHCIKYSLTLTDMLSLCDSPVNVDGYDLYIKDNTADLGVEPNPTTDKSWISKDIWFEDANGAVATTLHQGETYKVCARVHNRGNQPTPGGEIIYWHWTKAVIGGTWPYSWFDTYEYSCDGTPIIRGGVINPEATTIPSIPAGGSCVVSCNWTVPTIDYNVCSAFENNLNELWHYCLLARIIDSQEQPGEDGVEYNLAQFVLGSNNVASCNFTILSDQNTSEDGLPAAIIGVAPPDMEGGLYHIYCDLLNTNLEWGGNVHLYLTLPVNMYNNWSLNGNGYTEIDFHGKVEITANHAELRDLVLGGDQIYPIKVELEQSYINYDAIDFELYLVDGQGYIVGGERFSYIADNTNAIVLQSTNDNSNKQSNLTIDEDVSYVIDPAQTTINILSSSKIQQVDIYNTHGFLLHSTGEPTIDISSFPLGVYIVQIQMDTQSVQTKFIKQ